MSALVIGGEGLIGKAIVAGLPDAISCDIRGGKEYANLADAATTGKLLTKYDPVKVFVNAAYPRDHNTHTLGCLTAARLAAIHMAANQGGSIITLASIYGVVGPHMDSYMDTKMDMPDEYALAKGGIIAWTRSLACKYAKFGVRVNCVSPGGVYHHQPLEFVKRYEARVPMGRMATPEDVAGVVFFLASDWSKYVTGINICVDGGLTAW